MEYLRGFETLGRERERERERTETERILFATALQAYQ